jgi:hypothetical protein
MTNPLKGEVYFEARGETFTFKLGTNAQALIEAKTKLSWGKFIKAKFEDLGAADARLIFWAGLFRQHQMTEEDVGDLMDELGQTRVAEIFLEAFEAAMAKANGATDARPTRAVKARIGMNS